MELANNIKYLYMKDDKAFEVVFKEIYDRYGNPEMELEDYVQFRELIRLTINIYNLVSKIDDVEEIKH